MRKSFFILLSLLACSPAHAKQVAPAFLIVPGKSIGKVAIGDEQEDVRKKMGKPHKTIKDIKAQLALSFDDYPELDQWQKSLEQSTRDVTIEIWKRPKAAGSFKVVYERGVVRQISVSLSGYSTANGLSTASTFTDFEKKYKSPRQFAYVLVPDEQFGLDATLETMKDYVSDGLALFSGVYVGPSDPEDVDTVIVHKAGLLAVNGYSISSRGD